MMAGAERSDDPMMAGAERSDDPMMAGAEHSDDQQSTSASDVLIVDMYYYSKRSGM